MNIKEVVFEKEDIYHALYGEVCYIEFLKCTEMLELWRLGGGGGGATMLRKPTDAWHTLLAI